MGKMGGYYKKRLPNHKEWLKHRLCTTMTPKPSIVRFDTDCGTNGLNMGFIK